LLYVAAVEDESNVPYPGAIFQVPNPANRSTRQHPPCRIAVRSTLPLAAACLIISAEMFIATYVTAEAVRVGAHETLPAILIEQRFHRLKLGSTAPGLPARASGSTRVQRSLEHKVLGAAYLLEAQVFDDAFSVEPARLALASGRPAAI